MEDLERCWRVGGGSGGGGEGDCLVGERDGVSERDGAETVLYRIC